MAERLGDVLQALGRGQEALYRFRQGKALYEQAGARTLREDDPTAIGYQSGIAFCQEKIGDLLAPSEPAAALTSYEPCVILWRQLLERRTAGGASWQRGVAVVYRKIGDLQVRQGKLDRARQSYEVSLEESKHLQALTRLDNADAQCNLAMAYCRLGFIYQRLGFAIDCSRSHRLQYWQLARDHYRSADGAASALRQKEPAEQEQARRSIQGADILDRIKTAVKICDVAIAVLKNREPPEREAPTTRKSST